MRGASCTGKTRTAFEAVRACLEDWQLVMPKNAEKLLALLDANSLNPRTVLWLDEAQNFLMGTDGEDAVAYHQGWYDFTITVDNDSSWSERFVGHIEYGATSVTG